MLILLPYVVEQLVSPGAWLTDMCQERYEVREKKSSKKVFFLLLDFAFDLNFLHPFLSFPNYPEGKIEGNFYGRSSNLMEETKNDLISVVGVCYRDRGD